MKKLLMLIAAFTMTTLFAQANDIDKMNAAVEDALPESVTIVLAEQTDKTPSSQEDEKKDKEGTTEEK